MMRSLLCLRRLIENEEGVTAIEYGRSRHYRRCRGGSDGTVGTNLSTVFPGRQQPVARAASRPLASGSPPPPNAVTRMQTPHRFSTVPRTPVSAAHPQPSTPLGLDPMLAGLHRQCWTAVRRHRLARHGLQERSRPSPR
jgi:hypothetical protein